nr:hypothetical protein [uncultured Albidiferax sp.]
MLATLLGAVYAGRSATEAKRQARAADESLRATEVQARTASEALRESTRQNLISLHAYRLEIYKSFVRVRRELGIGGTLRKEEVRALWEHALVADLYFSESTTDRLRTFVDTLLSTFDISRDWQDLQDDAHGAMDQPAAAPTEDELLQMSTALHLNLHGELRLANPTR